MTEAARETHLAAGRSAPEADGSDHAHRPTPSSATGAVGASDGLLSAVKDAPVGGQAVIEGVMMRGVRHWAVAVRKPAPALPADSDPDAEPQLGPIEVQEFELPASRRRALTRLPFIRGVVALGGSLAIGMRALTIAANAQIDDGEEEAIEVSGAVWAGTMVVAAIFAIGVFFIVPVTLTNLIKHQLNSSVLFWVVEGLVRTAIFLAYMWLIARTRDMRRVFEYHGAEHKVISCYEAGDELVPERAALYSRFHPRCGTSFLLVVMLVSIFVFAFTGVHAWWILVLTRLIGIPVVVGISFEVIKWAGRNRSRRWVQWVMAPGMELQRLTTREPDLTQLEVAIASLQAVLAHETPGDLTADDLLGVEVVA